MWEKLVELDYDTQGEEQAPELINFYKSKDMPEKGDELVNYINRAFLSTKVFDSISEKKRVFFLLINCGHKITLPDFEMRDGETNEEYYLRMNMLNKTEFRDKIKELIGTQLSEVDMIARLLFHEESDHTGERAIMWTMYNRLAYPAQGEKSNLRDIVLDGYIAYMDISPVGRQKFLYPLGWMGTGGQHMWWVGVNYGAPTIDSWRNCVELAHYLVTYQNNPEMLNSVAPNPLPPPVVDEYGDTKYYQFYVANKVVGDDYQDDIGNNWFSIKNH